MKFGLYSSIANPPRGEQLDRCIDEVIAEAQLAGHRLSAGRLPRVLRAHGGSGRALRGEHRDPAPRLGRREIFVPRQALHPRGYPGPPAAISDAGAAVVDRRQYRSRRPSRRQAGRWLRRHAQHRPRERDAPCGRLQGGGAGGRTARRGRTDARRVGGPVPRGRRGRLRPARHDRLPVLLGKSIGRVPWSLRRRAGTFLLRLRHAHSGGPAHDKIMEAIKLFGERVLPYV